MVRTLAFQVGNTGSIPVQDANMPCNEVHTRNLGLTLKWFSARYDIAS